ncbi:MULTISPECIES: hypothetical protein [unclassified Pedobacter]|uniref:hypothetical protein n=1 Tax=unclassified Pedobacter TaxID=2628915 RepID=UPI0014214E03|nr:MULTISPECIES: hypothetical protein [unclassified Pedobacter]NII83358.1 hypothetical protein [Pedobacter sp. SG908]NMN37224.1 hypothetical protein [Pedobacter sp. SG918]
MIKIFKFLSIVLMSLFMLYCQSNKEQHAAADSFLPMQIGNLWYMNAQSYTEIQDTVRINKKLFYKFYSLVGGDAVSTVYLRIDEQNKLIEGYPDSPLKTYTRADFNAKMGDKFFTTGEKDENDNEVTVVQKTDTEMTFSFDPIYHPNLKGHPSQVKYIKGKGWAEKFKKLKIDGVVYQN